MFLCLFVFLYNTYIGITSVLPDQEIIENTDDGHLTDTPITIPSPGPATSMSLVSVTGPIKVDKFEQYVLDKKESQSNSFAVEFGVSLYVFIFILLNLTFTIRNTQCIEVCFSYLLKFFDTKQSIYVLNDTC